jgi:hypothetical protein
MFDRASGEGDTVCADDLVHRMLAGFDESVVAGDVPQPDVLVRALFAGELGSLQDGPGVNEPAPKFTLKSHDGRQTIRLVDLVGRKPIVLTFGNITCGRFRERFPGVEAIHERFRDGAFFFTIYVREEHPSDGWILQANIRAGIEVAQPRSSDERRAVATRCHTLLKCKMPLLVDDIDDRVGNAYSGLPARLDVIDRTGQVAYQSGRGPWGFQPGEMEQALVMCLME